MNKWAIYKSDGSFIGVVAAASDLNEFEVKQRLVVQENYPHDIIVIKTKEEKKYV